ncbi:hypothetical protein AB0L00_09005 [Actinoallomurus sp. NPDC052308]|uniref:hypothetical protein n=1 Tax=Actinoallomurus sp. NPDC052308 TaxID=3155530 RepID=UPI00342DDC57
MLWRAIINGILHNVQFSRQLDDSVIERVAQRIIKRPQFDLTPEEEYTALTEALRSGDQLVGDIPLRHDEPSVREFLIKVQNRLDALRPWPAPPYLYVDIANWNRFDGARPIARIHLWYIDVQGRLQRGFSKVDAGREALLLRLKSGAEVALVTPWWIGSDDIALMQIPSALPQEHILAEFKAATGFTDDEVTAL